MTKSATSSTNIFHSTPVLSRIAQYSPVLLAVLLMLPRLLKPQFGLFDDGRTLLTASKIVHGIWYTGADSLQGRFRPVHWLWFSLSYLVGGKNPFWFYIANTLAFIVLVAGLIYLVRTISGSRQQGWIAGFIFVLAGPVPESFLTLKGEVIQLTLIGISLLAMLLYPRAKTWFWKVGGISLITIVLILAYLTKETALVLLPVSLVWYLLARFWHEYESTPEKIAVRGAYFIANLLAAAIFFVLRQAVISAQISAGTYSGQYSFQFSQIGISILRWAGWLTRDFLWVAPISILAIVLLIQRRKLSSSSMILESFIWMGAWICIYLPWTFMAEYYMLPFAFGLAIFASGCFVEITQIIHQPGRMQWLGWAAIVLSVLLLLGTLFNNLTNTRVQLATDTANASMMNFLVQNTEPDSTIYINIQDTNEYYYEIQTQMGLEGGRPDLTRKYFYSECQP